MGPPGIMGRPTFLTPKFPDNRVHQLLPHLRKWPPCRRVPNYPLGGPTKGKFSWPLPIPNKSLTLPKAQPPLYKPLNPPNSPTLPKDYLPLPFKCPSSPSGDQKFPKWPPSLNRLRKGLIHNA